MINKAVLDQFSLVRDKKQERERRDGEGTDLVRG